MRAVITFHAIEEGPGPLRFPPHALEALLANLRDQNVPILTLDALLSSRAARGVALTFDDGLASVHRSALPILKSFGAPAHVFVATASVGQANNWDASNPSAARFDVMTWSQLADAAAIGMQIEAHTHTHPDLRTLSPSEIMAELRSADEEIEQRTGRKPRYFAYPYGHHNSSVRQLAKSRYRGSLTTELAFLGESPDPSSIPRLDAHYLRSKFVVDRLGRFSGHAYIQFRNLLRHARSLI